MKCIRITLGRNLKCRFSSHPPLPFSSGCFNKHAGGLGQLSRNTLWEAQVCKQVPSPLALQGDSKAFSADP